MISAIQPFENLAIVGMDAAWAGCDGLEAFADMVYDMGQQFAPSEEGQAAVSQAALLGKVARRALQNAGIDAAKPGLKIAALACSGTPLNLTWDWASSFTDLYGQANPLVAALAHAQRMFQDGTAELVIFAAGAAGRGPLKISPDILLAPDSTRAPGFDRDLHGWRFGEGAGAVALMPPDKARREGWRMYAVIRSAAAMEPAPAQSTPSALPVPPALAALRGCCQSALETAGVLPEQVGYIEAFASGNDALDGIEIAALAQSYRLPTGSENGNRAAADCVIAIGSGQANTGYLGAAAGLAALVRAALCLSQRMIPGAPGWSAPKLPALWRNTPFYVPGESRAWFEKSGGPRRLAGVNVIGLNGSCAHLIAGEAPVGESPVSEAPVGGALPVDQPASARANRLREKRPMANSALARGGFFLFPLAGNDPAELVQELQALQHELAYARDLNDLAAEYYETIGENQDAPFALAITGHTHEEMQREIEYALSAVPATFEKATSALGVEWQTPLGSYLTTEPAGRMGGVALVYPGAFNSYPGVGKDLFRLFPNLYERMTQVTGDLGGVIRERLLYPRSLAAISKEELAALEARLLADPISMLISGTTLAILYTHMLQETFKIRPQSAFGYSLGENSMMYATGVWAQGDTAAARLEASEAFRVRLAGPQFAIREYWGMPGENGGAEPLWSNYLAMTTPEKAQAAVAREERVYLTHNNTPRQVVIGGDPAACQRVLAELRCSSLRAPFDYALHCEVMRSEYGALAELHNYPVEKVPDLSMYTAANYGPMHIAPGAAAQREISQAIAHMLTTPLDFPRLVNRVYADGARVFIEAGAGGNCARWVDESLKGRPHLALSLNRRGTDDYTNIVRTLARLYSHRVPMDLTPLYQSLAEKVSL